MVLSAISTSQQMDFKRLVAYSSVVHITGLMVILLYPNPLVTNSVYLMVMVLHGILSPLIFIIVGVIYNLEKTRNLLLLRSVFTRSFILV